MYLETTGSSEISPPLTLRLQLGAQPHYVTAALSAGRRHGVHRIARVITCRFHLLRRHEHGRELADLPDARRLGPIRLRLLTKRPTPSSPRQRRYNWSQTGG